MSDPSSNPDSSEETTDDAVAAFLDAVDRTLGEYDQGYMDADATLALVRAHVDDLREGIEAEEEDEAD